MKFLADENIPDSLILQLHNEGYDILSIRESQPGIDDQSIVALSADSNRIIITHDKDFGGLSVAPNDIKPFGVLLFRLHPIDPDDYVSFMYSIITGRNDWGGHISVITDRHIRMRRLQ